MKSGPHPCNVCKATVDQSRPVTGKGLAILLGLKEDEHGSDYRVCNGCYTKAQRKKHCPLPTCTSTKGRGKGRLRHMPGKWLDLSKDNKELIINELRKFLVIGWKPNLDIFNIFFAFPQKFLTERRSVVQPVSQKSLGKSVSYWEEITAPKATSRQQAMTSQVTTQTGKMMKLTTSKQHSRTTAKVGQQSLKLLATRRHRINAKTSFSITERNSNSIRFS